jgi:putative PIN family toxin of toxin-antitoxin system
LLWGGKPAEIIKSAEEQNVSIFLSEEIVAEITQVLTYPKIKNVYKTSGLTSEDLVKAVLKTAKFVKVTKKLHVVEEHSADDKFIECAKSAKADYIISGDKHLLKMACYKRTKIVSVSEFIQILTKK